MPNLTLASGPVTNSDSLTIELVTPPDAPAIVLIRWPGLATPSVSPPGRFPAVALAVIALLDQAMMALQRIET